MKTYKIKSNSTAGVVYTVVEEGGEWQCDCPAGQSRRMCLHIKKAQHLEEFGREMTVNEHLVEMVRGRGGRAAIEVPLLIGEDVELLIKGTIIGTEEIDQFNGTYDRVAKVKAIQVEKIYPKSKFEDNDE